MKLAGFCGVVAATLITTLTWAADLETTTKEKTPRSVPSPSWWETITLDGFVEGGVMINFDNPIDGLNFGHLYTDRHATPTLNQAILTVQRPLDRTTDYGIGFKIQWMYGSDVRYTPFLGELDYAINARRQITVNEAYAEVHLPWFTYGGVDVKFGQFVTLLGLEQITAIDNPFYSHAYMYRFGVPFNHTGVLTTTRVFPWLAIHAGVTTGVNTSIGWPGDNNSAAAFLGGFGLTFLKGDLLINGSAHIGPEIPKQLDPLGVGWPWGVVGGTPAICGCDPNHTNRYYADLNLVWKATENLTLMTDLNYVRDDGFNLDVFRVPHGVEAFGVAQYAIYQINDWLKVGGRAEVWRDRNNFFVAAFPGHFDFINASHGFAYSAVVAPAPTTYFGLTAGVTLSPKLPENPLIAGLILRPEIRWDASLNRTTPFAAGTRSSQFLFGLDVIAPFKIR